MQQQTITTPPVPRIILQPMRPEPKTICRPGERPFFSPHQGEVIITGTLWDLYLRDLYDLIHGGRYAHRILFRIVKGAALYATAGFALDTGDWPVGTNLMLRNQGRVQGKGGKGGDVNGLNNHTNGEAGGDAIRVGFDLELDNTDGEVFAGGGGGGSTYFVNFVPSAASGGGGAGTLPGPGGDNNVPQPAYTCSGQAGTSNTGGSGCGGAGGISGDGGDPGEPGQDGTGGSSRSLGGAAGRAIVQSGGTVTITAGNNSTQIKGAIV